MNKQHKDQNNEWEATEGCLLDNDLLLRLLGRKEPVKVIVECGWHVVLAVAK